MGGPRSSRRQQGGFYEAHISVTQRLTQTPDAFFLQNLEPLAEQKLIHLFALGVGRAADGSRWRGAGHDSGVEIDLGLQYAFQPACCDTVATGGDAGVVLHANRSRIIR